MTHRARHDTTTIYPLRQLPLPTPIARPHARQPLIAIPHPYNPTPYRIAPHLSDHPAGSAHPASFLPVFTAQATHTAQPPAHLPSLLPVHRPISHRPLSTPPPRSGGPVQIDRRDAHTRARRLPGDRRHDDLPRRRDRGDCQPVPCTAIIKQGQLHYHATSAMCGISGTSDTSE